MGKPCLIKEDVLLVFKTQLQRILIKKDILKHMKPE